MKYCGIVGRERQQLKRFTSLEIDPQKYGQFIAIDFGQGTKRTKKRKCTLISKQIIIQK